MTSLLHMTLLILMLSIWAMMPNVRFLNTIQIKTHDSVVKTLTKVRHVPNLNHNLISLGSLEAKGFEYLAEGRVLKVSKGARVLLKGLGHGDLCSIGFCYNMVFKLYNCFGYPY